METGQQQQQHPKEEGNVPLEPATSKDDAGESNKENSQAERNKNPEEVVGNPGIIIILQCANKLIMPMH